MNEEEARALALNAFAQEVTVLHKPYVDMTGDLIAGLLFSQIMYWCMPNNEGKTRLRVKHENVLWLAKTREDWYSEIRISPKQYDRAIKILKDKGLVETKLFRFGGSPTVHIRPNLDTYNRLVEEWLADKVRKILEEESSKPIKSTILPKGKNPISPKGKMEIDERVISLTGNTTGNTSSNTTHKEDIESFAKASDTDDDKRDFPDVEKGKWQWESDKQYIYYCEKVLPKIIKKKASHWDKKSDTAYDVLITIVMYFFKRYRQYNGEFHPWYRDTTMNEVIDSLFDYFETLNIGEVKNYIEAYFKHKTLRKKPMKVFASSNILKYLSAEMSQDFSLIDDVI